MFWFRCGCCLLICALHHHFPAFLESLTAQHTYYDPQGNLVGVDGEKANLRAEALTTASLEYGKVLVQAEEKVQRVGVHFTPDQALDPLKDCPACAHIEIKTLHDGERWVAHVGSLVCANCFCTLTFLLAWAGAAGTPVPACFLSVSTDAMVKCIRFKAAGSSQRDVKGSTSSFLGPAAEEIANLWKCGDLVSKAEAHRSAAQHIAEPDACGTALHCSRDVAKPRGEVEITGIAGASCPHIFPVRNSMVPMYTPEMHFYYDVLLKALLLARSDLRVIYLDLACRYIGRFLALVARLHPQQLAAWVHEVLLLLPWMHAFDHNMDCQLKYSGLYQVRSTRT